MSDATRFFAHGAMLPVEYGFGAGVFVLAADYDAMAQRYRELEAENESLACNLRGKHATTGATYQHLVDERDALRAEAERLRRELATAHADASHYASRSEDMRSEVETLRQDAERYRWLRAIGKQQLNAAMHSGGHELDRFIDEAMEESQ